MILIILMFIIFALAVIEYRKSNSYRGKLLNMIPSLPNWPLIGNVQLCVPLDELWQTLRRLNKEYYPLYSISLLNTVHIHTCHPEHAKVILGSTKHAKKGRIYNFLEHWLGTGLLTTSGGKWQERRKLLTPAFHSNLLQNFTDIFIEETERMCDSLKREGGPIVKDLLPLASEHTLNIICETAMGCSLSDKKDFEYKYRKAVMDVGKIIIRRFASPWLYTDFVYRLTPMYWRERRLVKTLHEFTKTIIKERKQFHDQTNGQYLNKETLTAGSLGKRKTRLAMLDLLIAEQRNGRIDDEGIREEVDTFMFEGHDTSAAVVCFTIMLLAEHKEIQDQARNEINEVLKDSGGKLTLAGLQRLFYIERCIKESLRLYPSVHTITRITDDEVHFNGYKIPTGTPINVFIFDIHRDPNYWPNPEVFDPDRFLPENTEGRHPYCYIPFSVGPRNCIGQRFAMLELKTLIGLLLHNFRFEPVDYLKDVTFVTDLIIRPAHPIRTRFVPIT